MAEAKINEMIGTSLSQIRELVDTQTIIGDPIETNGGTVIIPVSKITVGYVGGGLDYTSKNAKGSENRPAPANFGGGGGTGVCVTPVAFLTVSSSGRVELISVSNPGTDTVDKIANLVDRAPDLIERIKDIFQKKQGDEQKDATSPESLSDKE